MLMKTGKHCCKREQRDLVLVCRPPCAFPDVGTPCVPELLRIVRRFWVNGREYSRVIVYNHWNDPSPRVGLNIPVGNGSE